MNLESNTSKASKIVVSGDDIDFDFKPITSGLGFHSSKTTEIKPTFVEPMTVPVQPVAPKPSARNINQIYQNELSVFYGHEKMKEQDLGENIQEEKIVRLASKAHRVLAYFLDLGIVFSTLGLVLTVMSRSIEMDLTEVWKAYPNEITPLVITLFCGFYLIYFSIFEKASSSTLGKNLLNISVVNKDNKQPSFSKLLLRSIISLANFTSLGLFSYFDLQNKVSGLKVIKVE